MSNAVTHSKRYGFNLAFAEAIASWLPEVSNRKSITSFITEPTTPAWGDATKIYYDPEKDRFIANFIVGHRTVSDKDVLAAIELVEAKLGNEDKKNQLLEEYADALNYYYNEPMIDDKGLFVKEGMFKKKYFTIAELEDLNEKYQKKVKTKTKRGFR
ncbi:MAG: hypothetical protein WAP74_01580 [Patescibacteria group bacterium]